MRCQAGVARPTGRRRVVDDVGVDPEHHADEFRGQDLLRVASATILPSRRAKRRCAYWRGELSIGDPFGEEECSSFALLPEGTGDGRVYCGQNWDWRAGTRDTVVMLRIEQPPSPTIVMQTEAGQVGRRGANSAGLGLNANGLGARFGSRLGSRSRTSGGRSSTRPGSTTPCTRSSPRASRSARIF